MFIHEYNTKTHTLLKLIQYSKYNPNASFTFKRSDMLVIG